MNRIVADPQLVPTFVSELPRLSAKLHTHLRSLEQNPTSASLILFRSQMNLSFANTLALLATSTYANACKQLNVSPVIAVSRSLEKKAKARAAIAARLMAQSSKAPLNISSAVSKIRVASKDRAHLAATYEMRQQFYASTFAAWELNPRAKKASILASRHDKDDTCDDNADEGAIPLTAFFSSGHLFCPFHIQCLCTMALILPQDNRSKKW